MKEHSKKRATLQWIGNKNRAKVIAVASGKGGTGKTTFSTFVALALAKQNNSVVIVDANLNNTGNYELLLPKQNRFRNSWYNIKLDMKKAASATRFPNIKVLKLKSIISYPSQVYWIKNELLKYIKEISSDYVIIDLGSPNNYLMIDLFLCAEERIVLTQDDPFAMEGTFNFLQTALLRKLQLSLRRDTEYYSKLKKFGERLTATNKSRLPLFFQANKNMPIITRAFLNRQIDSFVPRLIVNKMRNDDSMQELDDLFLKLNEKLGINAQIYGTIKFDRTIPQVFKDRVIPPNPTFENSAIHQIEKIVANQIKRRSTGEKQRLYEESDVHPAENTGNKPIPNVRHERYQHTFALFANATVSAIRRAAL